MSAFDQLDDSFPHGSVDGHRAGCRGRICPAPVSCADVYRRYCGDYSFRRRIDAGVTAAEIFESEREEREGVAARDRAAQRAEAERHRALRPARAPRARAAAVVEKHAEVARMHGEGMTDPQIAAALGMSRPWVGKVRAELALPAVTRPGMPTGKGRPLETRKAEIASLHEQGFCDVDIADRTGLSVVYVATLRRSMKLRANRKSREVVAEIVALPVVPEPVVDEEIVHGTARGYELGCRKRSACPAPLPCVDASLAAHRALRREIA